MRGPSTFAATVGHTDGAGSLRILAGPKTTDGCYAVHVKSIRLDGYSWRVQQPVGRYCVD
jgi:very-short-patch-repair endonuclease